MTKLQKNQRYESLDLLKGLCAFMVIAIHIPFPGAFGAYFMAVARAAVPIFLMITGFFYRNTVSSGKEKQQIKKMTALMLVANLLYLLWDLLKVLLTRDSLALYFQNLLSFQTLAKAIFLNQSPFGYHLWYLSAALYSLLVVACLNRINKLRVLYFVAPVLLVADLVLGKYSLLLLGREIPYLLVRNFLFVGIPYITVGIFLAEYREKHTKRWSTKAFTVLILFFGAFTCLERYLLVKGNLNTTRDHYIGTTGLAVALFMMAVEMPSHRLPEKWKKAAAFCGREAMLIYLIHPVLIDVYERLFWIPYIGVLLQLIGPLMVLSASIIGTAIFRKIARSFK